MDGEVDDTQGTGQEQQGQQGDQAAGDDQSQQQETQVGAAPTDAEIRAALAEHGEKIAELEAMVAEASRTVDSAEALAKQIEELKAASDEERVGFELRLAGEAQPCRPQCQGDHDPENLGHGAGRLHAKRGLQDGLHRLLLRDEDVRLRPRHQAARRRDGRRGGRRHGLLRAGGRRAAAHAGGPGGRRLHVREHRGACRHGRGQRRLLRRRGGRRSRAPARGDERDGRGAGLLRQPDPVHHADAQGRARRLLVGKPGSLQSRARALLYDRGGTSGSLLDEHRAALRRRGPFRLRARRATT